MSFRFPKFPLSRPLPTLAIGLGLLLVSGGVWQGRTLYEFAICSSSLAVAGPSKANAATVAVVATPTPAMPMKVGTPMSDMHAPTVFTLRTGVADGRMVYLGVGGDDNGLVNPKLMCARTRRNSL